MAREIRSRLFTTGEHEITLDCHAISYTIKRSPRAKYVRLEVKPQTGLTIVIPKSYNLTELPSLLKEKRQWILAKLVKYGHLRLLSVGKDVESGDTIPYLGRNLQVVVQQNRRNTSSVRLARVYRLQKWDRWALRNNGHLRGHCLAP